MQKFTKLFLTVYLISIACGTSDESIVQDPSPNDRTISDENFDSLRLTAEQCSEIKIHQGTSSNEWQLEFDISPPPEATYLLFNRSERLLAVSDDYFYLRGRKTPEGTKIALRLIYHGKPYETPRFQALNQKKIELTCEACGTYKVEFFKTNILGNFNLEIIPRPHSASIISKNGRIGLSFEKGLWVSRQALGLNEESVYIEIDGLSSKQAIRPSSRRMVIKLCSKAGKAKKTGQQHFSFRSTAAAFACKPVQNVLHPNRTIPEKINKEFQKPRAPFLSRTNQEPCDDRKVDLP